MYIVHVFFVIAPFDDQIQRIDFTLILKEMLFFWIISFLNSLKQTNREIGKVNKSRREQPISLILQCQDRMSN